MNSGPRIVKELKGHSGSTVHLVEDTRGLFVRKIDNVERNVERLTTLYNAGYDVPKIYYYENNVLEMEYIHGLDMKNYLTYNSVEPLTKFIIKTFNSFSRNSTTKDYTDVYNKKLEWLNERNPFEFTKEQLIDKLPKNLPCSTYHGDLTLENILFTHDDFYMIDGVTVEYDSYIFDIAKMRQDLECKWFLRNDNIKLDTKLQNIQDKLKDKFPLAFNDSLLILMLLRVYLYSKPNSIEYNLIKNNIDRLWKNTI
jgi:RIO-like serine/threonine protein kinase